MTDKSVQKSKTLPDKWQSIWKQKKSSKNFNQNRFYNLTLISFFIGLLLIFYFGHLTFISAYSLSKITIFLCVTGLLIPWRYYDKLFGFTKTDIFIFNIFGFGPLISGVLLFINYTFHSPVIDQYYNIKESYIETYGSIFGVPKLLIILDDNAYSKNKEFRIFEPDVFKQNGQPIGIKYSVADGLLGYRILLGSEFTY